MYVRDLGDAHVRPDYYHCVVTTLDNSILRSEPTQASDGGLEILQMPTQVQERHQCLTMLDDLIPIPGPIQIQPLRGVLLALPIKPHNLIAHRARPKSILRSTSPTKFHVYS
jgi:hypothetical protein